MANAYFLSFFLSFSFENSTFFVGEKLNKEHQLSGSPIKFAGETLMVGLTYLHGVYSNKTRTPTDESDETITARSEMSRLRIKKRSINARKENRIHKSNKAERPIDEFERPAADDTAVIRDGIAEYSVFEGDFKERQKTTFRELNEDYVETRRKRTIPDVEKIEQSTVKNVDKQQEQTIVAAVTEKMHSHLDGKTTIKPSPETCSRDTCTRA